MTTTANTVTAGDYIVRLIPGDYTIRKPAVFVGDELAHAADPELVRLAAMEANLGERRYAERGRFADVDDMYDRLNTRIAETKTLIAQQVIRGLAGRVEGDTDAAAQHAFFSRKAGCETCTCSPGVVPGTALRLGGGYAWVYVTGRAS